MLFLTNNSYYTPEGLKDRLGKIGINVSKECFYTSAMATASFLLYQKQKGQISAYVIGGKGLIKRIKICQEYRITKNKPDYVIVGETEDYDFLTIREAALLNSGRSKIHRDKSGYHRAVPPWPCSRLRRACCSD